MYEPGKPQSGEFRMVDCDPPYMYVMHTSDGTVYFDVGDGVIEVSQDNDIVRHASTKLNKSEAGELVMLLLRYINSVY